VTWRSSPWTADTLRIRLQEAQTTLRRIAVSGRSPSLTVTWWPDIVRDHNEAYGYTPETSPRLQANAQQIERMEEVLTWITRWLTVEGCRRAGLVEDAGWIVMARAAGRSWERIGRERKVRYGVTEIHVVRGGPSKRVPGGNSRPSLMLIEQRTLNYVASELNRTNIEVDRATLATPAPAVGERSRRGGNTIAPPRGSIEIVEGDRDC
jgi:hypothetical protein